jgi:ribosomal protein S18 acetylase RimI-like enzyme
MSSPLVSVRDRSSPLVSVRDPWLPPGDFFLYGVVDPASRRRGIGSLLFVAIVRFAHEHGASILRCEVQEANPDGLRFA